MHLMIGDWFKKTDAISIKGAHRIYHSKQNPEQAIMIERSKDENDEVYYKATGFVQGDEGEGDDALVYVQGNADEQRFVRNGSFDEACVFYFNHLQHRLQRVKDMMAHDTPLITGWYVNLDANWYCSEEDSKQAEGYKVYRSTKYNPYLQAEIDLVSKEEGYKVTILWKPFDGSQVIETLDAAYSWEEIEEMLFNSILPKWEDSLPK